MASTFTDAWPAVPDTHINPGVGVAYLLRRVRYYTLKGTGPGVTSGRKEMCLQTIRWYWLDAPGGSPPFDKIFNMG